MLPRYDSSDELQIYLKPTACLDADHPTVRSMAEAAIQNAGSPVERATRLYYAVRDGVRYDPYNVELTIEGLTASAVIGRRRGFCVAKAGVLVALARCVGIPARLGFADVRNHLATERLRQMMGTDIFYYHGFTELHLDGRWIKATPTFNIELCEKFGVRPLEFDGSGDAILHPFDTTNRRHMEYLRFHGSRADMPIDELREVMQRHYGTGAAAPVTADFHAEAELERRLR
jgi:transglutaminase-like putative cysteine protease